jgi:hypothetical protein
MKSDFRKKLAPLTDSPAAVAEPIVCALLERLNEQGFRVLRIDDGEDVFDVRTNEDVLDYVINHVEWAWVFFRRRSDEIEPGVFLVSINGRGVITDLSVENDDFVTVIDSLIAELDEGYE